MSARSDLIVWLRDVHDVPPRDAEPLILAVESAAEERGFRRGVEEAAKWINDPNRSWSDAVDLGGQLRRALLHKD